VTQTTPLLKEFFYPWGENPAILEPVAKFEERSCIHPRNIEKFKFADRQTADRYQTPERYRADTVEIAQHQNITCHAHFVAWQVNIELQR